MKRWIAIVMSIVPVLASAAGFWDGNATLQRGDSSFESGLFAASNSFAPDTEILVENLETGKTARVTVKERAGVQSSILVLLSPKAAEALDIAPGTIARVRVTIASSAPSTLARVPEDRASSPDPDINPAAAFGPAAEAEALLAQTEPEPAAAEAAPVEAPQVETAKVQTAQVEAPPAEAAPIETPPAETEDERLLQELAARTPQKQLFLPPREDEKFAYQKPVEPPAEAQQAAGSEQAPATAQAPQPEQLASTEQPPTAEPAAQAEPTDTGKPAIESVEAAAAVGTDTGAQTPLAEAQAPLEVKPEVLDRIASAAQPREKAAPLAVPEPLSAEQKKAAPVETPIAKPPEQKPAAAAPIAKALTPAGKSSPYFVQLAAYSAESLASGLAASLSSTYPVLVLAPPASGRQIYRVLIGPLNKAESGTLLNWFRYRGFPDAFVKRE